MPGGPIWGSLAVLLARLMVLVLRGYCALRARRADGAASACVVRRWVWTNAGYRMAVL